MTVYAVIIRLALAVVIGGLIGYEREFNRRPAGFRTHILVCVGATVISMIQLYQVRETTELILKNPALAQVFKADIGRLGAQVISGVGFLGAGTIMHTKGSVKGLTTAASLWVVACIGLGVGHGYYTLTILATACVFMVLVFLKSFEEKFFQKRNIIKLEIQYGNKSAMVHKLEEYFNGMDIKVKNIEFSIDYDEDELGYNTSFYTILVPRHIKPGDVLQKISIFDEIVKVKIE